VTVSVIDADPKKALDRSRQALDKAFEHAGNTASTSDGTPSYLQSLTRLAAVIASQPPVPPVPSVAPAPSRPDAGRAKLEVERARLSAELSRGASTSRASSDNPFDDGSAPRRNTGALRRRIDEIDRLLAAAPASSEPKPRAVVGAEVASLVRALPSAAPKAEPPPPAVADRDVMVTRLAPDRTWLLALGIFAAFGAALLPVGRPRAAANRRSTPSSRSRAVSSAPPPASLPRPPASDRPPRSAPSPAFLPRPPASDRPPRSAPPAVARVPSDRPAALSVRPSSDRPAPSRDESPVMAYPVVWRGASPASLAPHVALRDKVRAAAASECFVVAVSGPVTALQTKPALAAALAAAVAENPESRVLLVEADLQRPRSCEALGVELVPAADLVLQLEARVAGNSERHIYVLKCSPSLHVLPARSGSPTLILSTHFESLLSALRPFYDVIVLNAPSLEDTVACRAVSDVVDGVVVVGRPTGTAKMAQHPFSAKPWHVDVRPAPL
jgi:Mrp family chromosome partitioning ATPase